MNVMLARMQKTMSVIIACLVALALSSMVMFPIRAYAAYAHASASWSRANIGTGWASTTIKSIANAGDMDNNGFQDMILKDASGRLWFYPAQSATSFSSRRLIGTGWGGVKTILGGVDFDGDSNVDVLGIDASGAIMLYRGQGNGFISSGIKIGSGFSSASNLSITQSGFNRNPVLMGSIAGRLYAWQSNGLGSFTTKITYGTGWDSVKLTAISSDVTGDGIADMWVVMKSGELRLYAPTNQSGTSFTTYTGIGTGWAKIKYFLPTAEPQVVRAIFPDGLLRQYTLNSFTPGSIYVPNPPASSGAIKPNGKNCPVNAPIKGNAQSMIYHVKGGAFYDKTVPERCFKTEADAKKAGYRKSKR